MFTGNEDHSISLNDAAALTENYRETSQGGSLGGYFGGSALTSILQQENCVGIRIYYGRTENHEPRFVLVGVNSDGDDLYEGELAESSIDCPPNCSKSNPLNS